MSEIVITVGFPASGKSTIAQEFVNQGYHRLNRDIVGGTLSGLTKVLESWIKKGKTRVILDNTYGTVESRAEVIAVAEAAGIPIRCVWVATSIEDAQFNACQRMVRTHGKLLLPEEINKLKDPNTFTAAPLFRYRKTFEKPTVAEGFSKVEKRKFVRRTEPGYTNKALILDYDGTLRDTKSGEKFPRTLDDIEILPNRAKILKKYKKAGWLLLGVSNQSGVAKGKLTLETARDCLQETNRLLGIDIDFRFCPCKVPPIVCHCRKPQTGLGVELIETYKLDRSQSIMIGDMTTDKTFAARCGFQFQWADSNAKGNKKNTPGFFD